MRNTAFYCDGQIIPEGLLIRWMLHFSDQYEIFYSKLQSFKQL